MPPRVVVQIVLAPALLSAVAAPPAAQSQSQLDVSSGGEVRDIGARVGRVVWIAGPTRGAKLRTAVDGQAVDLPVEALPDGRIDLSVGQDAQGRVVVSYARCAPALSGPPRDCEAYAYTFSGGGTEGEERELPYNLRNVSEFAAAVDGDFLVLGRRFIRRTGGRERFEYVYAGRADGSTRLHRLPTGPLDADSTQPLDDLDIDLRRVTFTWDVPRRSVRMATLGAKIVVVDRANVATAARDGGNLYWSVLVPGEGGGTPETGMRATPVLSLGRPAAAPGFMNPFAVDAARFYTTSDDGTRVREVSPPEFDR